VEPDKYSPRRLQDSISAAAAVGWVPAESWRLVLGAGYDGHAVPDYALSATNLDFDSAGGFIGLRRKLVAGLSGGLSYAQFFPFTREVTGGAWDVRDTEDSAYVDDRFSPDGPYRANADGTYAADMKAFGVRVDGHW